MKVAQRVEAKAANRDDAVEYWGYTLSRERKSLKDLLGKRDFDLTIATSRHGTCLMDIAKKICDRWRAAGKILILFGAPSWGLYEIARSEGFKLDDYVDFVVNTIPFQGTETVRTEEALIASLATLVNLTELKR
jgi:predicted SPOUT superfamily RNA methylase MTH1